MNKIKVFEPVNSKIYGLSEYNNNNASRTQQNTKKFNFLYEQIDGTHSTVGPPHKLLSVYNPINNNRIISLTPPPQIDLSRARDNTNKIITNFLPPIYDQGNYGTCTANATALLWCYLTASNNSTYNNGKYNTIFKTYPFPSRTSIYYNARAVSGALIVTSDETNTDFTKRKYTDDGADPALFGDVFTVQNDVSDEKDFSSVFGGYDPSSNLYYYGGKCNTGFCNELKWSYPVNYNVPQFLAYNPTASNGQYNTLVPINGYNNVINSINNNFASSDDNFDAPASIMTGSLITVQTIPLPGPVWTATVNLNNLNKSFGTSVLYNTLKSGKPILLAYNVYSNFYNINSTGIMQLPLNNSTLLGGHCVLIVGWVYIYGGYYLKCANSWSARWGNRGYFYVSLSIICQKKSGVSLYVFIQN